MISKIDIVIVFLCLGVLIACDDRIDYLSNDLSEGWPHADSISFNIDEHQCKIDEIEFVVDHDINYDYQNLYLKVDFRNEQSIKSDTISIQLANEQGFWQGHCSGINCRIIYNYPVNKATHLNQITITQYSRESNLKGINHIGFNIK